jgi:hypothetical protein
MWRLTLSPELNPFAEFAGSGLFSWEKPADLDVLKGRAPFECAPPPPMSCLSCCPRVRGLLLPTAGIDWSSVCRPPSTR